MEDIRNYSETIDIFYDIYPTNSSENPFHHPRIPSIIDINKIYTTFIINVSQSDIIKIINQKLHENPITKNTIDPKNITSQEASNDNLKNTTNLIINSDQILIQKSQKIILLNNSPFKSKLILKYPYFTPKDILTLFKIPSITSFQIIGHILHLNLNQVHEKYKYLIGHIYLDKICSIKTVITKITAISTEYRNIQFELLAGENNLVTTHFENNLKFRIDYSAVYWNGKLQDERSDLIKSLRVNKHEVKETEHENKNNSELKSEHMNEIDTVCDPFCGVGPLVLSCLKNGNPVICNDLNSKAIECLKISYELNKIKMKGTLEVHNSDARSFLMRLVNDNKKIVNVFVFNLPEFSLEYVNILKNLKYNFRIVAYFFAKTEDEAMILVKDKCYFKVCKVIYVRSVSPSKSMYKIDEIVNFVR